MSKTDTPIWTIETLGTGGDLQIVVLSPFGRQLCAIAVCGQFNWRVHDITKGGPSIPVTLEDSARQIMVAMAERDIAVQATGTVQKVALSALLDRLRGITGGTQDDVGTAKRILQTCSADDRNAVRALVEQAAQGGFRLPADLHETIMKETAI